MISIKIIFTIIATFIAIIGFLPYLRDIFRRKTKPHVYTWLIWTITQGTAVFAMLYGGGGIGTLNLIVGLFFVFVVFLFSLRYGTRDITKSDTFILILALCAILVWWQLNQPLISVIMIAAIDVIGYIPSFRKSYKQPWSETVSTWILFVLSNIFAILALENYNALTLTYIVAITLANLLIFLICIVRRSYVKKNT